MRSCSDKDRNSGEFAALLTFAAGVDAALLGFAAAALHALPRSAATAHPYIAARPKTIS